MKTIKAKEIKCEIDRETSTEKIKGRAESINGIGLIHSVKIQKIEDKKYQYKVVAGRCSFLAMTEILGKKELKVPEEVSFIEGDAEIIAFTENDERTDLTLSEQIEKLDKLSERFGIAELASHLSRSPQWIAARIRLKELSHSWKEAMKENHFPGFTIGHYEAVAKFSEEIQDEILEYCRYRVDDDISVSKFAKELQENFTFLLKNAPWNTDGSYQGCGECPACIDRQNEGFLFEDMNDYSKAICQNRAAYFEKLNEFVAEKVEEARKENPEILLVSQDRRYPEGFPVDMEEIYNSHAWNKSTKKNGGEKALVVNGPQAGKTIYVEIDEIYKRQKETSDSGNESEPVKRPSSLAERKERKNKQRQRHAIDALMEFIEAMEYEIPDRDTIFKLTACLGASSICGYGKDHGIEEQDIAAYPAISELEDLDKYVWQKVTDNIIRDLKYGQTGPVEARWNEAEIISSILSFDLEKAFAEAVEALPDPKAWKALEAKEKQEELKAA
jgi:hypothetical protein